MDSQLHTPHILWKSLKNKGRYLAPSVIQVSEMVLGFHVIWMVPGIFGAALIIWTTLLSLGYIKTNRAKARLQRYMGNTSMYKAGSHPVDIQLISSCNATISTLHSPQIHCPDQSDWLLAPIHKPPEESGKNHRRVKLHRNQLPDENAYLPGK